MKNVAILTAYLKDYVKYDFYFPSEQLLRKIFNESELEIHYVSPHYYDKEKKHFTQHVAIWKDTMEVVDEPYKPDLLWVRMGHALYHLEEMFSDADFLCAPTMRLKHIDSNKYQMYQYLEDLQPKSTLLATFYFYPWLQEEFTEKVVVKPIAWSGGYGIEFYTKPELTSMEIFKKYAGTEWLHLVQNYQNFSKWAPKITDGNHDLRVVFLGNTPTFSIVRVPKKWSLKSNIADGGSQFSLPIEKIPLEVLELCNMAQQNLKVSKADIYSLDFAFCADDAKRYLIELNSSPWIWFPDEDKHYQYAFFQELADYMHLLIDENNVCGVEAKLDIAPWAAAFLDRHQTSHKRKTSVKKK